VSRFSKTAWPARPRLRGFMSSERIDFVQLDVTGSLRDAVSALVAVEMHDPTRLPLAIAPHESMMFTVQIGRGADPLDQKAEHGHNTRLTGIRQWTGSFVGTGQCVSLFALLTPLGAVRLLESRTLATAPRIRADVAQLLDRQLTRQLEHEIARGARLEDKLRALGSWLEERHGARRELPRAALRAGRAAMRLTAEPGHPIERLADAEHVSRRQLERDFEQWLGTSPHHLAQVARVQQVARHVHAGASLADAAHAAGFADQSHMTRTVRKLTGVTPRGFVRSQRTPIATGFRAATRGATVYF
jgi:AraC-like DNA-binding protein